MIHAFVEKLWEAFLHTHSEAASENWQEGIKNGMSVTSWVTALSHLGVQAVTTGKHGNTEEGCGPDWLFPW